MILMLNRLRRWHFDLAFFLGLTIFSWAYWYSKPRPVWTSYYTLKDTDVRNNSFTILGYSVDSQSIYTICETTELSKNWPIPQIQRWSSKTGELLEDYSADIPEEDRFLMQLPKLHYSTSFSTTLCADSRYFMVRYVQSRKKGYHYVRFYRLDGKPVGHGQEVYQYDHVVFLTDPTGGDRHWITQFDLSIRKSDYPVSVIDLDNEKPVRPQQVFTRGKMDAFPKVLEGRHLVFKLKETETTPMQFEIIDLQTGECQGFIPLINRFDALGIVDSSHYVLKAMVGTPGSYVTRLHFFRFDSDSHSIQPDHTPPLNELTSDLMQWLFVSPPYLIMENHGAVLKQQHQVIQTLLGWLARIGIVRNNSSTIDYRVSDMATRQLLRQVTGIPEDGNPIASPDWRSLAAAASFNDKYDPGLCLYAIPHYLWEPTLSWMQWLSWLLVIPWPLRYFVASQNDSQHSYRTSSPQTSPAPPC